MHTTSPTTIAALAPPHEGTKRRQRAEKRGVLESERKREGGRKEGRKKVCVCGGKNRTKEGIFLIGFAAEEKAASAVNDRTSSADDSRN